MNHEPYRIFVLEKKDPNRKVSTLLGTEDNRLMAYQDGNLWLVRLDHGSVPEPLRQRFTTYNYLYKHVCTYLETRNIKVVGVLS
jgi:hypothetical protein